MFRHMDRVLFTCRSRRRCHASTALRQSKPGFHNASICRVAMPASGNGWVAIIDDDDAVRRSLTRFFAAQGIPAEPYGSADAYAERPCGDLPSCIVLDVQLLTGMSSFELIDRMDVEGNRVPVIFITGLDELPPKMCVHYPELRDSLRKPFDVGSLIARVRYHLNRSAP